MWAFAVGSTRYAAQEVPCWDDANKDIIDQAPRKHLRYQVTND